MLKSNINRAKLVKMYIITFLSISLFYRRQLISAEKIL